ncbi:MAG: DUF4198 domain-containing protein [Thermoanaerobacterales bacterium]|nr:DUF4198 domain-containing protein [Thermoanaerobacterales bacterium]
MFELAPHNLWLKCPTMARPGETFTVNLIYGHHFEPEGDIDQARARVWAFPPGGGSRDLEARADGRSLRASLTADVPGVWAVLAAYDAGLWAVLADGRHLPGGRKANPGVEAVRDVHYRKFAKALVVCGTEEAALPGPAGTELEIVPLALRDGTLELAVLFFGKPLAGARVSAACRGRRISRLTRTDGAGLAAVNLSPGTWLVIVDHESAPADPARDPYDNLQAVYSVDIS